MQLAHLRSFLVVLEESSLTRAAARLHLGQPALSRQMAALEGDVGARLLERSSRGVLPTAAGQTFAAMLARPLQDMEDAILHARRFARGERETLRIGYLQSLARNYLNPALAAVRAAYPALRINLTDLCAGGQMRALREGQIDLALMGADARALARDFYVRKVQSVGVVAAVSADHRLASRASLRLVDLRGALFVGKDPEQSPGFNDWVVRLCRSARFRPRFAQFADSMSQMLSLAVTEGAVALIPEIAADTSAPSIVTRPVVDRTARWDVIAVWQRGRIAPPIKTLLDALPATPAPGVLPLKLSA